MKKGCTSIKKKTTQILLRLVNSSGSKLFSNPFFQTDSSEHVTNFINFSIYKSLDSHQNFEKNGRLGGFILFFFIIIILTIPKNIPHKPSPDMVKFI